MECQLRLGTYNRDWLTKYFEQMRNTVFNDEQSRRISVQLCNGTHAITITYDFDQCAWRLINASSSQLVSEKNIAAEVLRAFGSGETFNRNRYAVFMAAIIGLDAESPMLKARAEDLVQWNNDYLHRHRNDIVTMVPERQISILYTAAYYGNLEIVALFAGEKSLISLVTEEGWTPLVVAITRGHKEAAKCLIEHGIDVNYRKNNDSATPLMRCIEHGDEETAKVLLSRDDIDLNLTIKFSKDKLMEYAKTNNIPAERIDEFIKLSNTVTITALKYAEAKGCKSIVALIHEAESRASMRHRN